MQNFESTQTEQLPTVDWDTSLQEPALNLVLNNLNPVQTTSLEDTF
jgi:hypothetical protein